MKKLTCNDCKYYDVINGRCKITGDNHHGYDNECEIMEQETDTEIDIEAENFIMGNFIDEGQMELFKEE